MATTTINTYTANGFNSQFLVGFDYIRKSFVNVYLDGVLQEIVTDYEYLTDNVISFTVLPMAGQIVVIMRNTEIDSNIISYIDPAILSASDLNKSFTQPLHLIQELTDDVLAAEINKDSNGNIDLNGTRIINSGQPINDNDLATKIYVDINDDALQDMIERVDGDVIVLDNKVDTSIASLSTSFNTTINNVSNNLNNKMDDLTIVVDDNDVHINSLLDSHVSNLQTQINAIDIAGVKISAETNNGIEVKSDGLFVNDLSQSVNDISNIIIDSLVPNINDLTTRVSNLDSDNTAQWVKINDTFNKVTANTANINAIDSRVTKLEETPFGAVFNTIKNITSSNTSYLVPEDGWYKITVIGGGGGGGGGAGVTTQLWSGGGGGGGGGAGEAVIVYRELIKDSRISIVIGAGGASGSIGGDSSLFIYALSEMLTARAGRGGGSTIALVGRGSEGGAGYIGGAHGGNGATVLNSSSAVIGVSGGNGGNGGANNSDYGGGGGGGGGAAVTGTYTMVGLGGIAGRGGYNGTNGNNTAGGQGGTGSSGAVILEYFNPNL